MKVAILGKFINSDPTEYITKLISLFSKHNPIKYAPNTKKLSIIDSKNWGGTDPNLIPISAVDKEIDNLI
jgi:hypothetical protein